MRTFFSKASLYLLALVVLLMAFLTWSLRRQHKLQVRLVALQSNSPRAQEQRATQKAIALLCHALVADTQLTYAATTTTWASYGGKTMKTQARITRAPKMLSIAYLDGDKQGLHTGFSERSFWRQSGLGAPMRAFASTERDTTELATSRFATLLENYSAQWKRRDKVDGRPVDVVELWPFEPVDGAEGPGKRLWIDCENSLILKVETFNHQLQPVMGTEMRDVTINPDIAPDTFKTQETIRASAEKQPWVAEDMGRNVEAVKNKTGIAPPQVAQSDLPPGFKLETVGTHRCPLTGSDSASEQSVPCEYAALSRYTDGMNTLTLFSMKTPVAKVVKVVPNEESCEFGPGALVTRDAGAVRLIAVGDLPTATLRRVLDRAQVEASAPVN